MPTLCIYYEATKRVFTKQLNPGETLWITEADISAINPDHGSSTMMDVQDVPASELPKAIKELGDQSK